MLSDNQKAASFIWKPEDGCQCPGCTGLDYSMTMHDPAMVYPPDMHRPENYMRALENIVNASKYSIQLNNVLGTGTWMASVFIVTIPNGIVEPTPFFGDGTLAGVILELLVAIYDQEHK